MPNYQKKNESKRRFQKLHIQYIRIIVPSLYLCVENIYQSNKYVTIYE